MPLQRNSRVEVRLDDKEMDAFRANVEKTNLTQSAYLRTLINGCVPVEAPPAEYNKLILQLRYIGANINRILQRLESFGNADTAQLSAALHSLDECEEQIVGAFLPQKR